MQEKLEGQISELKIMHQREVDVLTTDFERQLKEQAQAHKTELDQIGGKLLKEKEEALASLKQAHAQEIAALKDSQSKQVEALRKEHEQKLVRKEQEHADTLRKLQQEREELEQSQA